MHPASDGGHGRAEAQGPELGELLLAACDFDSAANPTERDFGSASGALSPRRRLEGTNLAPASVNFPVVPDVAAASRSESPNPVSGLRTRSSSQDGFAGEGFSSGTGDIDMAAGEVHFSSCSVPPPLTCPLWVQFLDPVSRRPYFVNVLTQERTDADPDPDSEVCVDPITGEGVLVGGNPRDMLPEVSANSCSDAIPQAVDQALPSPEATPAEGAGLPGIPGARARLLPWRDRPARTQQVLDPGKTQYTEGHEQYNLWFGRYESDRFNPKDREPAPWRCEPEIDSGWTEVDLPGAELSYFCLYFARGCCDRGYRCRYYHHVPTQLDADQCDIVHDIFGRERFANHRSDFGGVGSFNSESKTLFVGDLRFDRTDPDTIKKTEAEVLTAFVAWGDVEHVRVIPSKAIGFVRFAHRAAAEFAKVVMGNRQLGHSKCIRVRWALDDPNPRAKKQQRLERRDQVDAAATRRAAALGLTEVDLAGVALNNQPKHFRGPTAPYPNTLTQHRALNGAPPETLRQTIAEFEAQAGNAGAEGAVEETRLQAVADLERLNAALAKVDGLDGPPESIEES